MDAAPDADAAATTDADADAAAEPDATTDAAEDPDASNGPDADILPDADAPDASGGADAGSAPDAGSSPCLPSGQPAPAGTPCDDGDPCNGAETCDGAGHCISGPPPVLDDGDPCTLDACDPQLGITHTACSPIEPSVPTTLASATAFLFTGAGAPQTGVAPGTIRKGHAAVVRGHVATADGAPFAAATITIVGHPEYGSSRSFADGTFMMAVNGGGPLTADVAAPGFLRAQRTLDVPWNDYACADDVVLVPYDTAVNAIDLQTSTSLQTAQGSLITDADGARRATLMFTAGTSATVTLPDGSTAPLSGPVHVRATEVTTGPSGFASMPGTLPHASAYTYAVELSVDEAVSAGARRVDFDQPVAVYLDNFLGLPAGIDVPAGYYDPTRAAWIASENGRVITIVGESNGLADLDTDGDGATDAPAALATLGITDAERSELAILYTPGASLWRVPVDHFTGWDFNFGFSPPADASPPPIGGDADPKPGTPLAAPCTQSGSIIECQNQTLGETIPITGTPHRLHYRSDRVPGRIAANTLDVPLAGSALPASLARIDLTVEVAGRVFTSSTPCPCAPGARSSFTWDGLDVFGRALQGAQPVKVTTEYVYPGSYALTDRFGYYGNGVTIAGSKTRREVSLPKVWTGALGIVDDHRARGLGGWSLTVHSEYDPVSKILYRGDGTRQQAHEAASLTFAGGNGYGSGGDGGPALSAQFERPWGIAFAPDGSLYVADYANGRVRRVDPSGTVTPVAGGGSATADGVPAVTAHVGYPADVEVGPDGSVFFVDASASSSRVLRVDPGGIIHTVAGTGGPGFSGDGGPAIAAQLYAPVGIAVASDGTVYVADEFNMRVRRVSTDGTIATVAGGGALAPVAGVLAVQAQLGEVTAVALDRHGALYFATDMGGTSIFRVGQDGKLALAASGLGSVYALCAGTDGVLDFTETARVRRVLPDGTIVTIAGATAGAFTNEGGPAAASRFQDLRGLARGPDGDLYLADFLDNRIIRVAPPLPGLPIGGFNIAAEDGRTVDVFDQSGRHVQTQDGRTGTALYTFGYDPEGRLASISDVNGLPTQISRDPQSNQITITAPHGQATVLGLDANGWLYTVTDPAQATVTLGYGNGGLLTSFTDAKQQQHTFQYDALGRLHVDQDPAGGSKTLDRTSVNGVDTVTITTGLGRASAYATSTPAAGGEDRTFTLAGGLGVTQHRTLDETTTTTRPDGTTVAATLGQDPRFGMQAPFVSREVTTTPGGLVRTITRTKAATSAAFTDTTTINGHAFTNVFDRAAGTVTLTSPLGRTSVTSFDAAGRMIGLAIPGLLPVARTYDSEGRRWTMTQGTRSWLLGYDPQSGLLASITDPMSQTTSFTPDADGRMLATTRPDQQSIGSDYDANGNLHVVTPPGRPAHLLDHDPVDRLATYTPPDAGAGPTATSWFYDADGHLATVTRPDNLVVSYTPDGAGRLGSITLPAAQGLISYSYDPASGQLATATGPSGITLTYGHDGALLTDRTWSGAATGHVHRGYDDDFHLHDESVNGGLPVTFAYDNDGLLSQAGAMVLSHDPQNGLYTGSVLGVVTDVFAPDAYGAASSYMVQANGTTIYSVAYTPDPLGRIFQRVETIAGVTHTFDYVYDPVGRLTDVFEDGVKVGHYDLDANGNRTGAVTPLGAVTGVPDAQDRLSAYGTKSYTYTAAGELTSVTDSASGQTTSYAYDALGNLRQALLPDQTVIDYVVDAEGHRIWKQKNGVTVQGFLWSDALEVAAELDGSGNVVARFIYATHRNVPDMMVRGGVIYRIITDHLGSPRLVVDTTTGNVVQQIDYDEFGRVLGDDNPGWQPFGFAGGLYDRDTELVRFGARDYDAQTGRWTAKDPLRFDGGDSNLYAYCGGDPVNWVDPDGSFFWFLVGGAVLIDAAADAALVTAVTGGAILLASKLVDALTNAPPVDECGPDDDSKKQCDAHLAACLETSLADLRGRVAGATRCDLCHDVCKQDGAWPTKAYTTWTGKPLRCDYWNH